MLKITELLIDERLIPLGISSAFPSFSWKLDCELENTTQTSYRIILSDCDEVVWDTKVIQSETSTNIKCTIKLKAYTQYKVHLEVNNNHGYHAIFESNFYSGKLDESWCGKWITSFIQNDKHNQLPPELFQKKFNLSEKPIQAILYTSALGIYQGKLNGERISDIYFAPGYTHYQSYLQFQTYDVTEKINVGENVLRFLIANGWYLGTIGSVNNNYGKSRGLISELHLLYSNGTEQIITTDKSWEYTKDTEVCYADFYNGETIDLRKQDESTWKWNRVLENPKIKLELKAHIGAFVKEDQRLIPTKLADNIYDFKQNHSGIVQIKVKASKDTRILIRHAEILNEDGSIFTKNLRKAKQLLTLICGLNGEQEFAPQFTFMGFRYIEIISDKPIEVISLESIVLTSDVKESGSFICSDPLLTRFQKNIEWGQRSNFIDIPTDCPQRDERMGWTGDIAVFASTASQNRNIKVFMRKWLYDLSLDQRPNGTIPVTIPEIKKYQPTPFHVPIAIWGDATTMVPWAIYKQYGDKNLLEEQYDSMKRYTLSEIRAAARVGREEFKYVWNWNPFQYGDWCAPDERVGQWKRKGKYLATAFFANSVNIMFNSAKALGKVDDEKYFGDYLQKIKDAYASIYIHEDGKLLGDFQSHYVCALYFELIPDEKKTLVVNRLVELVRLKEHRIQTGFAGTPYLAFALADNGYIEDAYKVIQNTQCPSWLYTVKAGGTTVWERWDALDENGYIQKNKKQSIADMVSFNHYAYGAVGDFYYRRILGIEPVLPGYQEFIVKPIIGGTLEYAKGSLETIYGLIKVKWKKDDNNIEIDITVPTNTKCIVMLPNNTSYKVGSGTFHFDIQKEV